MVFLCVGPTKPIWRCRRRGKIKVKRCVKVFDTCECKPGKHPSADGFPVETPGQKWPTSKFREGEIKPAKIVHTLKLLLLRKSVRETRATPTNPLLPSKGCALVAVSRQPSNWARGLSNNWFEQTNLSHCTPRTTT